MYSADTGVELAYTNDDLAYGLPNGIGPEVTAMKDAGVDFVSTCIDLNGMKTLAQELQRQGMDDVVLYHPNTYNQDFVAEAGDLFEGDIVSVGFRPFEADSEGTALGRLPRPGWTSRATSPPSWPWSAGSTPRSPSRACWPPAPSSTATRSPPPPTP